MQVQYFLTQYCCLKNIMKASMKSEGLVTKRYQRELDAVVMVIFGVFQNDAKQLGYGDEGVKKDILRN